MRAYLAILVAVSALAAGAGDAAANGRFPAADMLLVDPSAPSRLVLRATYGLLLSNDGGRTWDWLCESAVGYGQSEDPSLAIAANGRVIAGISAPLVRSDDHGCTWTHEDGAPPGVIDLALRPAALRRVYAIATQFAKVEPGGASSYHSQLLVSEDAGATWVVHSTLDPSLVLGSVEVAPSSSRRVYLSGVRERRAREPLGVLLVSDDDGATWAEHEVTLTEGERGVFVAAVDMRDADRIYLRTSGLEVGRLLVSETGGGALRTIFTGGPLSGFSLASDGETIYVGGTRDGVNRAKTSDYVFEKRSSGPVQCLALSGRTLWACAPSVRGFVVGASSDEGVTFLPKLTLGGMRGPLQCFRDASTCAPEWAALQSLAGQLTSRSDTAPSSAPADKSILPIKPLDAGRASMGNLVGTETAPKTRSSCNCMTGSETNHGPEPLLLTAALALLVGARRRRRLAGPALRESRARPTACSLP